MANQQQPSLMDVLRQLFSPTTWAALRYALTAISPLLSIFGFAALTPGKIDGIVGYAREFGTAAMAVVALAGIAIPATAMVFGVLSATVKAQVARWHDLAKNPTAAGAEVQTAIIAATAQLAQGGPHADEAAKTLITATVALPQVQTIVTDKATAQAIPDPGVVAAPK